MEIELLDEWILCFVAAEFFLHISTILWSTSSNLNGVKELYLVNYMVNRKKLINPRFYTRLNSRRFQLLVTEIQQLTKFAGRCFESIETGLDFFLVAISYRTSKIYLNLLRNIFIQSFDAVYTSFDVIEGRLK